MLHRFGEDNIEVFISNFTPLEFTVLHMDGNPCVAKAIITKEDQKVIGLHIAAPNAGEIMQGFGVAIKKGMYLSLFDI